MKFYTKPRSKPTVIIVTMIDIFSVLLIFFIVATTFKKEMPAIKISLPEAKEGAPISQVEPVVLTVTSEEKIFLNTREIPVLQLGDTLHQLGKQSPLPSLALQADKKASFGLIIKVMDMAKSAGFPQLPAYIDQEVKPKS